MKTNLGNMALLALLWCVVTLLLACGVEPLSPETSRSSVPLPKGDQPPVKARVVSVIDGATIEVMAAAKSISIRRPSSSTGSWWSDRRLS